MATPSASSLNLGSQGVNIIPRSLKKGLTVQKCILLKVVPAGIEPGKLASQARALTTRLSALSIVQSKLLNWFKINPFWSLFSWLRWYFIGKSYSHIQYGTYYVRVVCVFNGPGPRTLIDTYITADACMGTCMWKYFLLALVFLLTHTFWGHHLLRFPDFKTWLVRLWFFYLIMDANTVWPSCMERACRRPRFATRVARWFEQLVARFGKFVVILIQKWPILSRFYIKSRTMISHLFPDSGNPFFSLSVLA